VRAACVKINAETQNKLGRRNVTEKDLFVQAFTADPPQPGKPRLRVMADDGSQTFGSIHRGISNFAEGRFAAIRNPISHTEGDLDENEAPSGREPSLWYSGSRHIRMVRHTRKAAPSQTNAGTKIAPATSASPRRRCWRSSCRGSRWRPRTGGADQCAGTDADDCTDAGCDRRADRRPHDAPTSVKARLVPVLTTASERRRR
jgi:hypothetical protein